MAKLVGLRGDSALLKDYIRQACGAVTGKRYVKRR